MARTGRPSKYETPQEMQEAVDKYFSELDITNQLRREVLAEKAITKLPTITGLMVHLGFCSRQSFYDYEEKDDFSYTIKRARLMIEAAYEEELVGRYGNTTGLIFSLKNNFSWTDRQEIEHSGKMQIQIGKEFDGI